jgi:membrane-associated HD superfamily phosphohydrolase
LYFGLSGLVILTNRVSQITFKKMSVLDLYTYKTKKTTPFSYVSVLMLISLVLCWSCNYISRVSFRFCFVLLLLITTQIIFLLVNVQADDLPVVDSLIKKCF